ncbi:MAG: glycerate kinase [Flaviflexus sp.]|nr:glycerate kinase [Flaviflexus sp.]
MKIVIAPDSFKESMSAPQAARAIERGLRAVTSDTCHIVPMSDGGEGFLDALAVALDAERREVDTIDCLGRPIRAQIGVAGPLAIIETSRSCGLDLIPSSERDIRRADTRGVGQLMRAALDAGAQRLLVGIGGSATNDGGAGMLTALGARFLDSSGEELEPNPDGLARLATVDTTGVDSRLAKVEIQVACDVTNPLLGSEGAAAIYGPQKGASTADVEFLDGVLDRLATCWDRERAERDGAGAAGGLGYALIMLGAQLRPGFDLVAEAVGLRELVADADLVITGEGKMDGQTLRGKVPAGVLGLAGSTPVIALAGSIEDEEALYRAGFVALIPLQRGPGDLEEALAAGEGNATRAAEMMMRLALLRL